MAAIKILSTVDPDAEVDPDVESVALELNKLNEPLLEDDPDDPDDPESPKEKNIDTYTTRTITIITIILGFDNNPFIITLSIFKYLKHQ